MEDFGGITKFIKLAFLLLILTGSIFAGTGSIDASFDASAYGQYGGLIHTIAEQSDGKFIVAGGFTDADGSLRNSIARLNSDGSNDLTFNPPRFYAAFLNPGELISAVKIQNDGKILVGGFIGGYGTTSTSGMYRLNSDGSIDNSFTVLPRIGIADIEILPDNKILYSGDFGIVKLNSDGTLHSQTNNAAVVRDFEVQSDGKIVYGASLNNAVGRLNADLTIDGSFTTVSADSGHVESLEILANGKIVAVGSFQKLNGVNVGKISRINSDGSLDTSFNTNGIGASDSILDLSIKSNGKIIISGYFFRFNGQSTNRLIQLNSNGSLDTTFQSSEPIFEIVWSSFLSSNEDILIGRNNPTSITFAGPNSLIKIAADGTLDSGFVARVTRQGSINKIKEDSNGKIYIGGVFRYVNDLENWSIARLNSDGSVDPSFVSPFNQNALPNVKDIEIQSNGKLIVSSIGLYPGLYRLNTDGSFDTTFSSSTADVYDAEVLPNGKILFSDNASLLRRLNSNGTIDSTFNTIIANSVYSITIQPDGKIIAAGNFAIVNGVQRGKIARFHADGILDSTFNPPGGANFVIYDVELQPSGKILVSGDFTTLNGSSSQQKVGRLNSDGTLDTSFSQNANSTIATLKLQSDGKILVGGRMSTVGGISRVGFARLNSDGSLDTSFIANCPVGVLDIVLQSDNKILLGGEFLTVNGEPHGRIARLMNAPVTPAPTNFDFDGDGRSDIGVFRPSENNWYQLLGANYNFSLTNFGINGDVVAPADFDGDGNTDLAIFRPSNGNWWYLSSLTNTQVNVQFGQDGDIPRPSDFDGDGKADFVVFRPTTSQWFRFGSTGVTSTLSFGLSGDKPLVGDFDGDGKSDVAIYRPSTGDWWWQSSLDNSQRVTHWGISTDIPSPGDYDGDGITDFAVYRPSTGVWYIYNSSTQQATIIQFGIAEDKPIPADYDGDGKVDIAVYRPSTGVWYMLRSTAGYQAIQFGISSDIPIPNALIP